MNRDMVGKVALITGGSSGIGRAAAQAGGRAAFEAESVAAAAAATIADELVKEVEDCLEALSSYAGSTASLRPALSSPVADSGSTILVG